MSVIFELSSTAYEDDRPYLRRALSHMETLCGSCDGYALGDPERRAGWTFFKIIIRPQLHECVGRRFADMIGRYRGKPEERFRLFMEDYLHARGCAVRVRAV